jgi:hypothetical protein
MAQTNVAKDKKYGHGPKNTTKDKKYGHMAQKNIAKDKTYGQLGQKIQPRARNMDTWPKQM